MFIKYILFFLKNTIKITYIMIYKPLYKSLRYVNFIYAKTIFDLITFLYKLPLKKLIFKKPINVNIKFKRHYF